MTDGEKIIGKLTEVNENGGLLSKVARRFCLGWWCCQKKHTIKHTVAENGL